MRYCEKNERFLVFALNTNSFLLLDEIADKTYVKQHHIILTPRFFDIRLSIYYKQKLS